MDDRKSIQTLFLEALEIEDTEKRAAYLTQACGEHQDLRQEVEELIAARAAAGRFLDAAPDVVGIHACLNALASPLEQPTNPRTVLPLTEKPGDRVGHYKLLQKIGEGGCGVVYMAEQEVPLRRKVALKVIKLGMDTEQVIARFEAERQALALMDHPNIARVLEAGATETGRPFFVMELVRGIRITDYCDQNNLNTRERLGLFIQVCQAVQHAHQKGVIHRDLKPSNILITVNDGVPMPKVIDFGIAKATAGRLTNQTLFTAFEQFLGTPAYMSPEQAVMTSQDIDTRSDIYSLGVLLYELLTGKTPFDTKALLDSGLDELRRTIREREPVRPSTRLTMDLAEADLRKLGSPSRGEKTGLNRSMATRELIQLLRGDLDWIVMKCLEKDRARRYETANGLASDLKRHLSGEPVIARPPSTLYRLQKAARRNRLAFTAGLAVAAALLTGAAVSTWQAVRAERERRQVQRNVVRQYVANGTRLVNQGDLFGSLLWYAEALRLDAGDPRREEAHRIRIAAVLRQCPKLLNVLSHGNMLYHAEFSHDGTKVLTTSDDRTARLWDTASGKSLQVFHHDGEVYDGSFSTDGRRIVTSSKDKTARVWDTSTGNLLWTLPHNDTVWRARFSLDNRLVATACQDETAQVWDAATGKPLGLALRHDGRVEQVTFSPDGALLGTVTGAGMCCVWDLTSGRRCFEHAGGDTMFFEVSFSPDSQRFLTCEGSRIRVWDRITFKESSFSPLTLSGDINDTSFSPDGREIVAAGDDFTAQVWDANTGRPLLPQPVRHVGRILGVRISPDGRRLATASEDGSAQAWSTTTGQAIGPPLKHILHVKYVRFNSDGRRLLGNSCDQAARVWDMATDDVPGPARPIFTNECRLISPDGAYVLLKGDSNAVCVAETQSGRILTLLPHTNRVTYASFAPDSRLVVTACMENNAVSCERNDIFLWDGLSGRQINRAPITHAFNLLYVAFSPDNRRLLTCGFDFSARVWDAATGQPLTPPLRHGQRVSWGAFSPDGSQIVTASWDKTVRVWRAVGGEPLTPPLSHKGTVVGAFWSPDSKRLHTLTQEDDLQVWDLSNGEPLTPPRKVDPWHNINPEPSSLQLKFSSDDLPRDNRSVADLVLLAQMLAVGRIDSGGNLVPLQLNELTGAWQILHSKYPDQFATTSSQQVAWHRQQVEESNTEGNKEAARFHLARIGPQPFPLNLVAQTQMSQVFSIPPTAAKTGSQEIDLSAYCNVGLREGLDQDLNASDSSSLQQGFYAFGGVRFDVRGMIYLDGQAGRREGQTHPKSVNGIRISRKCRLLHFLHAAGWADEAGDGTRIGTYVLHYADGQVSELPIVVGRDLRDCSVYDALANPLKGGAAGPVWFANSKHNAGVGAWTCLYKSTRENPRPAVDLVSIDFVSAISVASPFLVALTVE